MLGVGVIVVVGRQSVGRLGWDVRSLCAAQGLKVRAVLGQGERAWTPPLVPTDNSTSNKAKERTTGALYYDYWLRITCLSFDLCADSTDGLPILRKWRSG